MKENDKFKTEYNLGDMVFFGEGNNSNGVITEITMKLNGDVNYHIKPESTRLRDEIDTDVVGKTIEEFHINSLNKKIKDWERIVENNKRNLSLAIKERDEFLSSIKKN